MKELKVNVLKNGPLMVQGELVNVTYNGNETKTENAVYLCRCGASKNKPYCDGTHKIINFED